MSKSVRDVIRDYRVSFTKDKNIQFENKDFGSILVFKNTTTQNYEVKHHGAYANFLGKKAIYPKAKDALAHAFSYIEALANGKVVGKALLNVPSSDGRTE